jgi:hypothetical protein
MANCNTAWMAMAVYATKRSANALMTRYEVDLSQLDVPMARATITRAWEVLSKCKGFTTIRDGNTLIAEKAKRSRRQ